MQQISTGNTKAVCLFECYYGLNDNYTDIYDGKMSNCCQKVRGNKTKQRSKQNKKQNKKITQNTKTGRGNFILQVLFHRLFREIHLNFISHILFDMTVQNRR